MCFVTSNVLLVSKGKYFALIFLAIQALSFLIQITTFFFLFQCVLVCLFLFLLFILPFPFVFSFSRSSISSLTLSCSLFLSLFLSLTFLTLLSHVLIFLCATFPLAP